MATHHYVVSFSFVLQANTTTATPDGAQKANTLLRWNKRLYHSGGSNYMHCEPRAILFDAVIDAVTHSGLADSGQHAEVHVQETEATNQAVDDSFRVRDTA